MVVAVALFAAGCVGENDDPAPQAGIGDEQRFPVTVEHALGTTTIECRPERVVTLGVSDADIALALGVVPVGIHSLYEFDLGVGPWAEDKLNGQRRTGPQPTVRKGRTLNFEGIAAERPDLILNVSASGDRGEHETLSRIAPTVAPPKGAPAYAAQRRDATRLIATSLGIASEGDRLVRATEDYLAGVAALNPAFRGRTITYLDVFGDQIFAGGRDATVVATMGDLGFGRVPHIRDLQPSKSQNSISSELVSQVDADVVLIYSFGASEAEVMA